MRLTGLKKTERGRRTTMIQYGCLALVLLLGSCRPADRIHLSHPGTENSVESRNASPAVVPSGDDRTSNGDLSVGERKASYRSTPRAGMGNYPEDTGDPAVGYIVLVAGVIAISLVILLVVQSLHVLH